MATFAVALVLAVTSAVALGGNTARATIHEGPVGSWCSLDASGNFNVLAPPGITPGDGKGPDSNTARPLIASGMISIVPFNGSILIDINEDHPAVHTLVVGDPIFLEEEGIWVEPFIPDPNFSAFANCPKLPEFNG